MLDGHFYGHSAADLAMIDIEWAHLGLALGDGNVAGAVMECGGGDECSVLMADNGKVDGLFASFGQVVRQSQANVTLAEFVRIEAEALRADKMLAEGAA